MRILETIKIPAKLEYLHRCMHLVSSCAKQQGFDNRRINEIELVTEESLVNIFNYAYGGGGGDVEIACLLDRDEMFIIEITDAGVPFNILDVPDPDVCADIDHRNIGGLGIFMIRQLMDDVKYRREGGKNILTLMVRKTKNLSLPST